jgi:hypothetical protein
MPHGVIPRIHRAHLASTAAAYVNGIVLDVNGGRIMM